mgnify:CR=1 FL=1
MKDNTTFNLKKNIKTEKGFTLQDLVIACLIITLFVGTIGTMMFLVYKTNVKADLTSQMCVYAVQILEDIDKISYEEAQTMTGSKYKEKFSIPAGFNVQLSFSNYGEGEENIQDVMKIVDLRISYTILGEEEAFTVQRLKIKEL